MVITELKDQSKDIIHGHNLSNMRCPNDFALMADSEIKLRELVDKLVKECKRKGLSITCKKTKCMVSSKRDSYILGTSKLRR